ncbi:sigma 54-interacting transcriptional regulator [bacterium]|nr:sigma 54-interacting transcriptional regulator [bacterium]
MQIDTIRFYGYPSANSPSPYILAFETADDLKRARENIRLGALLMRNDDLEELCEYETVIRDRGKKHPARSLLSYFLHGKRTRSDTRMPILRCEYIEAGRLIASVAGLLDHAADRGVRNTYILGVQPDIFEECLRSIEGDSAGYGGAHCAASKAELTDRPVAEEMLDILTIREVPEAVSSLYLGTSKEVQLVHQLILRTAEITDPVLIVGESGTGKELVARSIHEQSTRRTGPFRAVNCGAIPTELFESELFGTTKSAFTNSAEREGLWAQANGGTLFLDEIGDLSLLHQVKILRALEDGYVRRVGGNIDEPIDARIVSATNRDLAVMVKEGQFREDLYYRIHGIVIYTPALRNHPDDIPQMAISFWSKIAGKKTKALSTAVLEDLKARRWLGNGRELRMFLSSLHGLFRNETITPHHLRVVDMLSGFRSRKGSQAQYEKNLRKVDQLRHYRRIMEVLSSLRTSLRPVLIENLTDLRTVTLARVVINSYAEKLDSLADEPEYFSSIASRRVVIELADALRDFSKFLETGAGQVREYWQRNVQSRYQNVDSGCFTEIQTLLDEVEK